MSNEIRISKRAKKAVATDGSSLAWEGVLFIPHFAEGETSAAEFLRLVVEIGLEKATRVLKGLFFAVYENPRGERFAFVDNCGYFYAYRSENLVSADFVDFLDSGKFGISDIDLAGITDLLREGLLFFDRTPIEGVTRIAADSIISEKPVSSGFSTISKGLIDIFTPDDDVRPPDEIIAESLESFRGRKIAIDLSGGLDTRLTLAFCLAREIPFTAFSHGVPGHPDIEIPKRLAEVGGFEYRPVFVEPNDLPDDLDGMLSKMDYLHNTISFYDNYKMNLDLLRDGFDLRVQSGSAVMLRDFWMFSDWPFCKRWKPNFARLYSIRMKSKSYPGMFKNTHIENLDRTFDDDIVRALERRYSRSPARLANEACAFHYRHRAGGGRVMTFGNRQIPTFPLFCDYELIHSAANMRYSDKRMHRFFREHVSSASPALARIKTDRGQSFRDGKAAIMADKIALLFDLGGRLYRKIRYRVTGKPMSQPLTHADMSKAIRALFQFPPDLKILQKAGFINPSLSPDEIPTGKIGNIIAAAEIVKKLA